MQIGIIMPGKKNFDPNFKRGEGLYWVAESNIPDMSKLPKDKTIKASIKLIRAWKDDTLDEMIELDWMVAENGKINGMANILKRLLSINANIKQTDKGNEWITPEELMGFDVYPEADDIDGLIVVANLKEGKPWKDKFGKPHTPAACFSFRAPTVEEGHAYAQKTQYYATELNDDGYPEGFKLLQAPAPFEGDMQ